MVTLPVAKAKQAFQNINSTQDFDQLFASLRCIKNSVIGNPTRKRFFLEQGISKRYKYSNKIAGMFAGLSKKLRHGF
jgi:hypothetical protein